MSEITTETFREAIEQSKIESTDSGEPARMGRHGLRELIREEMEKKGLEGEDVESEVSEISEAVRARVRKMIHPERDLEIRRQAIILEITEMARRMVEERL